MFWVYLIVLSHFTSKDHVKVMSAKNDELGIVQAKPILKDRLWVQKMSGIATLGLAIVYQSRH
jgi:hypothetical protein